MHAERFDALVGIAGCDKSEPGHADGDGAAGSAERLPVRRHDPAGHLQGAGRHDPGRLRGRRRRTRRARSTTTSCSALERAACPTTGSCAGMYTANTMACVGEALGMSLPGSASPPAVDYRREVAARESGIAVTKVLELDLRPRQILTKEAFENAIAVVMAVAGSTNAVLHLLAIAREAHVELTLDDFDRDVAPHPAPRRRPPGGPVRDERPRSRRRRAGRDAGAARPRAAARRLPDRHRQDPGARTSPTLAPQRARRRASCTRPTTPIHPWGGIAILRGNLAPDGAVIKAAGMEGTVFEGTRPRVRLRAGGLRRAHRGQRSSPATSS